mmetsp:Transcript_22721/g.25256  ORF Transcript_22721/g.25256 Transcript_22721/m.25256 type:complete len:282 (+) Transcript_22721:735-1580(+)
MGFTSPFDPKGRTKILASPGPLFAQISNSNKNNIPSDKSSANFVNPGNSIASNSLSNMAMNKMLDSIPSLDDESYAATKAILEGKKAIDLEHGDTDLKKKRKAKLKMKTKKKGFKLSIPTENRFLPKEPPTNPNLHSTYPQNPYPHPQPQPQNQHFQNPHQEDPSRAQFPMVYQSPSNILQPTPTQIINSMNASGPGDQKSMYLNQLSNKAMHVANMESPYINMFMMDSRCYPNQPTDNKNKIAMSPITYYGQPNADMARYQNQFSGGYYLPPLQNERKDN